MVNSMCCTERSFRHAVGLRLYHKDVECWQPLFTVKGRDQLMGGVAVLGTLQPLPACQSQADWLVLFSDTAMGVSNRSGTTLGLTGFVRVRLYLRG
jgi:hypothetical protein